VSVCLSRFVPTVVDDNGKRLLREMSELKYVGLVEPCERQLMIFSVQIGNPLSGTRTQLTAVVLPKASVSFS
jgi:hypothetical protein